MKKLFLLSLSMYFFSASADCCAAPDFNTTDEYILVNRLVTDTVKVKEQAELKIIEHEKVMDTLKTYIDALKWVAQKKKGKLETDIQKCACEYAYEIGADKIEYKPSFGTVLAAATLGAGAANAVATKNGDKIAKDIAEGKINKQIVSIIPQCIAMMEKNVSERQEYVDALKENPELVFADGKLPKDTVQIKVKNPMYDVFMPMANNRSAYSFAEGWEWVYSDKQTKVEKSYPDYVTYYVAESHPEYGVVSDCIYNMDGKLLRALYCGEIENRTTVTPEFDALLNEVMIVDYNNNKYDIKNEPAKTQEYIQDRLGLKKRQLTAKEKALADEYANAFTASMTATTQKQRDRANQRGAMAMMGMMFGGNSDEKGRGYISQLKKDHEPDFKYLYSIERIDDTSFRLLYMNAEKGQTSYAVKISYVQNGLFKSKRVISLIGEDNSITKKVLGSSELSNLKEETNELMKCKELYETSESSKRRIKEPKELQRIIKNSKGVNLNSFDIAY